MLILQRIETWKKWLLNLLAFMAVFALTAHFRLFCWLEQADKALASFKYKTGLTDVLRLIAWRKLQKRKIKRLKRRNKAPNSLAMLSFFFFHPSGDLLFEAYPK
jgi:hypothetical protein